MKKSGSEKGGMAAKTRLDACLLARTSLVSWFVLAVYATVGPSLVCLRGLGLNKRQGHVWLENGSLRRISDRELHISSSSAEPLHASLVEHELHFELLSLLAIQKYSNVPFTLLL